MWDLEGGRAWSEGDADIFLGQSVFLAENQMLNPSQTIEVV